MMSVSRPRRTEWRTMSLGGASRRGRWERGGEPMLVTKPGRFESRGPRHRGVVGLIILQGVEKPCLMLYPSDAS